MPWHPAAQPIPLAAEHDPLVLAMLGRVAGRLRLVLPAWGQAAPPAGATVTGSCRMVCGIDGINHMLVPRGESVQQVTLRADGCVAVDHRAWNQPLGLQARTFLTVDVGRDRIRCYLRRHRGRQSSAGEHAMILMLRQPQAATRLLVAALEALLPRSLSGIDGHFSAAAGQ